MQGTTDFVVRHECKKAEPILGRVYREKSLARFLEYVVESSVGSQMRTELYRLGQDAYDPLHFREGDTDLVRRAAAFFALFTASAGMIDRQERREVEMRLMSTLPRKAFPSLF